MRITLHYFPCIVTCGEERKDFPKVLYGFDLKSAILILQTVLGYRTRDAFGIAVD
jgi:hypothetical protein